MSIVTEINRLSAAKTDIAAAIGEKGVTVPYGTMLDGMADLILQISGGSVEPYAVIVAHYHAGETCTCTQGSTVLTAPSGLTSFAFVLPSGGTWTVSSTDGVITASRSVTITAQYQVEDVYLHEYYIVKDGRLRSGISVQTFAMKPYSNYSIAAAAPTFVYANDLLKVTAYNAQRPRCGVAAFFPAVDLTGYTLLIATGEFYNTTGNNGTCVMSIYTEEPADGKFNNSIQAEQVSLSKNNRLSRIEIPIVESRGLTRNIGFFLASQGENNDGHAYITDLWLQ